MMNSTELYRLTPPLKVNSKLVIIYFNNAKDMKIFKNSDFFNFLELLTKALLGMYRKYLVKRDSGIKLNSACVSLSVPKHLPQRLQNGMCLFKN